MKYKVLGERLRWATALDWGSRRPLRGIKKRRPFRVEIFRLRLEE